MCHIAVSTPDRAAAERLASRFQGWGVQSFLETEAGCDLEINLSAVYDGYTERGLEVGRALQVLEQWREAENYDAVSVELEGRRFELAR